MFLPIRTDRPLRRKPVINIAIIVTNIVVHLLLWDSQAGQMRSFGEPYLLDPVDPEWYQFITCLFMHQGWAHLFGNMLFLYIFGNAVEDRLGRPGYLAFYLAGGVLACLGHALFAPNPLLGASGAVSAVSGGFLILFPVTRITLLVVFFFIGFFEVPSMYFILFYFAKDLLYQVTGMGGVAYMAHLTGTVFGMIFCALLLKFRVLAREHYDLLSMLEHRKRRQEFRNLAASPGFQPWDSSKPGEPPRSASTRKPEPPVDPVIFQKRSEISRAVAAHNLDRACELYAELLDTDGEQVLSQRNQLDVANHFAKLERYSLAARTYELLINTYKQLPDRDRIQLMLALIYIRYLKRGQRARELLADATPRLHDDDEKAMAQTLQAELEQMGT